MSTFVTVGNSRAPFSRLVDAVSGIATTLPQPVVVQTGHTPWRGGESCIIRPFLEMGEFDTRLAEAGLLILHAGVTVIQGIRAGKVPVVMPRRAENGEIIDNHQVAFARELARTGKVVVVERPEDLPAAIELALQRQAVPRESGAEAPLVGLIGDVLREIAGNRRR